jgi:XTP/dITP diphosphohydrolase
MTGEVVDVLFATGNGHKIEEANVTLSRFGICAVAANGKKIEIQSESLTVIAKYAASLASDSLGAPVMVEDSGLFIESLSGFPGPYSSYTLSTIGCEGILKLLTGVSDRGAFFECVVAFCDPGSEPITFDGRAYGVISQCAAGSGGFGFDPIFIPSRSRCRTFAQMALEEKETFSHRGVAFKRFAEWFRKSKMAKLK